MTQDSHKATHRSHCSTHCRINVGTGLAFGALLVADIRDSIYGIWKTFRHFLRIIKKQLYLLKMITSI